MRSISSGRTAPTTTKLVGMRDGPTAVTTGVATSATPKLTLACTTAPRRTTTGRISSAPVLRSTRPPSFPRFQQTPASGTPQPSP